MGVPTSEVGYTSAMTRREDHEVHKDMRGKKKLCGDVAACHRAACVLCAVQNESHSAQQYKLPDDGYRPKHVAAILMCSLM